MPSRSTCEDSRGEGELKIRREPNGTEPSLIWHPVRHVTRFNSDVTSGMHHGPGTVIRRIESSCALSSGL
jgi:hypothetical protein